MTEIENLCKRCSEECNPYDRPALRCEGPCGRQVHLGCLDRGSPPSNLRGDVFFDLHCRDCDPLHKETIVRKKLTWLAVVVLTLYNLREKSSGISRKGYFHWKSNICSFIERNWDNLMRVKKKKQWAGTISGMLSHFKRVLFMPGNDDLDELGWWKLMSDFPPEVLLSIYDEFLESKKQNPSHSKTREDELVPLVDLLKSYNAYNIPMSNGYQSPDEPMDVDEDKPVSTNTVKNGINIPDIDSFLNIDPENLLNGDIDDSALQKECFPDLFFGECLQDVQKAISQQELIEIQKKIEQVRDSHDECSSELVSDDFEEKDEEIKPKVEVEPEETFVPKSLFRTSTKRPHPWNKPLRLGEIRPMMSEREEEYLYLKMEKHKNALDSASPKIRRLFRKLAVRRLKRQNGMRLLNLDTLTTSPETPRTKEKGTRQLDRFISVDKPAMFEHRLQGPCDPTSVHSPYTNRLLKPFIRRDVESQPLWLNLMGELMQKTNANADFKRASIDYSYVRPQHISALNSLCARYFWPGIDLTECLQYPDFTCVVLYKKVIIGFATMVPDVGLNEAYITFLFTRPEWRNAGIATFMLYHLIQTCMGKDITLHVSATNPALILYQKFGFKVEEFVQDFYDKYIPPSSKECRHALKLRLSR